MASMPAAAPPVTVGVDTPWTCTWPPWSTRPGGCSIPRRSRPPPGAMSPWSPGPNARGRWSASAWRPGTYGAGLARFVRADGLQVLEVNRPDRSLRRRRGKSDPIDAQAAARATLAGVAATIPKTREGQVEMIRVLRVARRGALKARVAAAEQLHGVLSSAPEELRQPLLGLKTKHLVGICPAMRPGP